MDVVLGIRTQVRSMVGANVSTELWQNSSFFPNICVSCHFFLSVHSFRFFSLSFFSSLSDINDKTGSV